MLTRNDICITESCDRQALLAFANSLNDACKNINTRRAIQGLDNSYPVTNQSLTIYNKHTVTLTPLTQV